PTGFGDLLVGPNLRGGHAPTLYERYPLGAYTFDTTRLNSGTDWVHIAVNNIASGLMLVAAAIIRGAIVLLWTMFDSTSLTGLANAITGNLGATASALLPWLLPSALAIGGLTAYVMGRNTQGGSLGQLLWVGVAGILAISFAVSPQLWVQTLTDIRNAGTTAVLTAASTSVTTTETPFPGPAATFGDSAQENMLRTSGDAIWRSYVATPWCYTNFGSRDACEAYGPGILELGVNADARSD